ncbi:MAG TPA: dihydropteroate synthase [Euzebyales bacterium]|nr:dihydropteroate synthase [Euzebyales bacterium]
MRLGPHEFDFNSRIAVMGIVNRTPDSFHDRGATVGLDAALALAEEQVAAGADIIDVGGVKAGPGDEVDVDTERERVVPFVERFRARTDVPVSVDTYRPAVARAALDAGADIVNDVTGLSDPEIADVVAQHPHTALVLTHHGGPPRSRPFRPDYDPDVVTAVRRRCAALIDIAVARGVGPGQLIVDPGYDMFKTTAHSLELTRHIDVLTGLGHPVLVALSNKDFLGEALDLPLDRRGPASLAAAVFTALHGARIVRAHDVAQAVQALRLVEVLLGWRAPATQLRGLD